MTKPIYCVNCGKLVHSEGHTRQEQFLNHQAEHIIKEPKKFGLRDDW